MTIEELKKVDKDFVTAADVAEILGTDPNSLRWQAKNDREALGFPVVVIKSRVKIPRVPFIRCVCGEAEKETSA